jgi:hypothetical protein
MQRFACAECLCGNLLKEGRRVVMRTSTMLMIGFCAAKIVFAQPCEDFSCDSAVVAEISDTNNLTDAVVVALTSGRISAFSYNGSGGSVKMKILPESIGRLSSLRTLDLSSNEISEIPASIGLCSGLRTLKISNNRLTDLPKELMNVPVDTPSTYTSYGSPKTTYYLNVDFNKICSPSAQMKSWISARAQTGWESTQICKNTPENDNTDDSNNGFCGAGAASAFIPVLIIRFCRKKQKKT